MMTPGERDIRGYFIFAVGALAFVMLYIWQSVEVTRIRLDYKRMLTSQEQLVKQNDAIQYEIEKVRALPAVRREAEKRGMRRLSPEDIEKIDPVKQ